MEAQSNILDPWLMTIGILGQLSGEKSSNSSVAPDWAQGFESSPRKRADGPTIRFLERATTTSVTLAWLDPLRCVYGNQEWHLVRARHSGVCAVSGRQIQCDEYVYRPQRRRPQAVNADAMILRDELEKRL
ncbi:hypothetical protein QF000_004005 [Paraburkholderia atlantica]|uniref:DUF3331 domain-containing protein n=1 Tax=Paraburkholderia atlantica TaxID=2654982 RepID=A0A6I1Q1Z4_PARAM|nr:DUF3331 domain-containing protein [Paraburkholderia atlantica]MBB5418211.1 hypothetical protein [Paraburkholderia atlantica]MBB5429087.1 hypothetical protein [Paraburkholderia atlantica]MPW11516.1 DUF3331 domain-containing protein [Paraburkholderia atlantica]NUY34117.1 DUF3331 domain-containing protein [Paraburkholderia atlantica]